MQLIKISSALIGFILLLPMSGSGAETGGQPPSRPEIGLVTGQLLINGRKVLTEGRISLFWLEHGPPYHYGKLRRVPEITAPLKEDGTFRLRLLPGRYFMGALSRDLSLGPGPPQPGEQTFSAVDEENTLRIVEIKSGAENNLGPVSVVSRAGYPSLSGLTISGMVTDDRGHPFAGAFLFIKFDPDSQRPHFIWGETGEDGRFKVTLPAGRDYYLLAKDTVKVGRPAAGNRIGAYNGPDNNKVLPAPVAVTGQEGENITGIRIVLHEVPAPGPKQGSSISQTFRNLERARTAPGTRGRPLSKTAIPTD